VRHSRVSGSKVSSRSYGKDDQATPAASVDIHDAHTTLSWHAVTLSVPLRRDAYF